MELIQKALVDIAVAVLIAVGGLLVAYIGKLTEQAAARVKNEKLDSLIYRVSGIVQRVVDELQQTTVDALKAKGEFTPEVAATIKAQAVAKVKAILGEESIGLAKEVLGDLDALISALIESAINRAKQFGFAPQVPK